MLLVGGEVAEVGAWISEKTGRVNVGRTVQKENMEKAKL